MRKYEKNKRALTDIATAIIKKNNILGLAKKRFHILSIFNKVIQKNSF